MAQDSGSCSGAMPINVPNGWFMEDEAEEASGFGCAPEISSQGCASAEEGGESIANLLIQMAYT